MPFLQCGKKSDGVYKIDAWRFCSAIVATTTQSATVSRRNNLNYRKFARLLWLTMALNSVGPRSVTMEDFAARAVMIVGTGPAGLATAWRLAESGVDVLLLEAGGPNPDRTAPWRNDAVIADERRHAPMALAARRGFGGTSALWGGRAVPLNPIDLARRDWVAHSGWPVSWDEVAAWYPAACAFLDCGPAAFDAPSSGVDVTFERWCAQPNIGAVKATAIAQHPRIRLETHTTVTRIHLASDGSRASAAEIFRDGQTMRLPVRAAVIAAGGVETARLLLHSRADSPAWFGGEHGALGRYYMGHIYGSIADIVFAHPGGDAEFDYAREATGHYLRKRWTLPAAHQTEARLLNMSAWPEAPDLADARHRSAVLSLGYLALAAPVVGPRLVSPGIRARKLAGGDGRLWPHVANVLRDPFGAAAFMGRFALARYASRIRKPGFFPLNPARRYSLFHHGEHAPNPDSRVTLTPDRDETGMLRARIDLRFSEQDAQSVARGVAGIGAELEAQGVARLDFLAPEAERAALALSQASDGYHQIGTARMSADPRDGVVDANARVHGVSNLFLAGSCIFPTSGQANPTLTAVALAFRLAAHLQGALPHLVEPASGV
jgi:choline dehydrogenase-like flavoprotein